MFLENKDTCLSGTPMVGEWVSELVYLTSLLKSQGPQERRTGRRAMRRRMKGPQTWIHRVSNPGPSGLKSSVLPLDQAHRAHLWSVFKLVGVVLYLDIRYDHITDNNILATRGHASTCSQRPFGLIQHNRLWLQLIHPFGITSSSLYRKPMGSANKAQRWHPRDCLVKLCHIHINYQRG